MIKPRTGPWTLSDLADVPKNGRTVFSCFHCGGGSTMGYKLAGYDVLGGVEIDPQMMAIYRKNHHPELSFNVPIQDFNKTLDDDTRTRLSDLDILDGSPPCSVFSMAGKREKKWGGEHQFREGQALQRLDDLFFHFIETARLLQPKVVIAENVKGIIAGNARGYVIEIFDLFRKSGYRPQLFLLNAAYMGVPQARERTFFIATRDDLAADKIELSWDEPQISVSAALDGVQDEAEKVATKRAAEYWKRTRPGDGFNKAHPKGHLFTHSRLHPDRPSRTLIAACHTYHWDKPRRITQAEAIRLQTFPDDYNRLDTDMRYVCGMSVPPFMTQRVALEVGRQVFGIEYDRGNA